MAIIETYSEAARSILCNAGLSILAAPNHVQSVPGLYSIHAVEEVWSELGLVHRAGIPLYVGKSESSLADRELGQHFAIDPTVQAQTGSSTVRRSFAALLRDPLGLRGVPRNKIEPERFANFGLEPEGDHILTRWMHAHLTLSVWPLPVELAVSGLEAVEVNVIRSWRPPLNIKDNPGRLRHVRVARARMATDAQAWALAAVSVE